MPAPTVYLRDSGDTTVRLKQHIHETKQDDTVAPVHIRRKGSLLPIRRTPTGCCVRVFRGMSWDFLEIWRVFVRRELDDGHVGD